MNKLPRILRIEAYEQPMHLQRRTVLMQPIEEVRLFIVGKDLYAAPPVEPLVPQQGLGAQPTHSAVVVCTSPNPFLVWEVIV
jgi:hypothetical protein